MLSPTTLEGRWVRLVPLTEEHAPALWQTTVETEVWPWMPVRAESEDGLRELIRAMQPLVLQGAAHPFCMLEPASGAPIGATGYWNPDAKHRRVEIGMTWVTRRHQRTRVNTESKLLLLRHAFEVLDCIRVEFKADARNARSRAALRRIGAIEEGVLRHHMVLPDGVLRDSAYFSVLREEWPAVEPKLGRLLADGTERERNG